MSGILRAALVHKLRQAENFRLKIPVEMHKYWKFVDSDADIWTYTVASNLFTVLFFI